MLALPVRPPNSANFLWWAPWRTDLNRMDSSQDARSLGVCALDPDSPLGDWFDEWQIAEDLRQARLIVARCRRERLPYSASASLVFNPPPAHSDDGISPSSPPLPLPLPANLATSGRQRRDSMRPFAFVLVAVGLLGGALAVIARQAAPELFPLVVFAELGLAGGIAFLLDRPGRPSDTSA